MLDIRQAPVVIEPIAHVRKVDQTTASKPVNVLAYVHLRNIYGSTGAGRVARQLTEHLAKRDDIHLRVLADAADHARILPLVGEPWTSFEYRLFDSDTSRQQAKWFVLDRPRGERYWPEAQVVFCTAESYVPTKSARLAVTLHDAAYFEADAHLRDRSFATQRLKWQLLYRRLVRRADLFHTVSHFSAERLAHFFPAMRSRLQVVHNAVAPHFFDPVTTAGTEFVHALGLSERPFILVPGGLHFRKNAELILEAWPLLKSLHPELLLAVVNHSNAEYVERAKAFGNDVRVLGFVPEEGLRALYSAAQIVWFPSRYEGFGMPVIEAMACGAPVVASRASSLPEIAADAAILASPQSAGDHVEALDAVLTNARLRTSLAERGAARAALFTWESSARQLKKAFDSLV